MPLASIAYSPIQSLCDFGSVHRTSRSGKITRIPTSGVIFKYIVADVIMMVS